MRILTLWIVFSLNILSANALDIYVNPNGNDNNKGTKKKPVATIYGALKIVEKYASTEEVNVWFAEGKYYFNKTVVLGKEFSGSEEFPVKFAAVPGEKVIFSGAEKLEGLIWEEHKNGILKTQLPEAKNFNQLFVNEERQIRARFPDYDYEDPLRSGKGYQNVVDGTNHRPDKWFSYDPEIFTKKDWSNPTTGIVHAFQSHNWGNMQYRVAGVAKDENKILLGEGAWQLQRDHGIGAGRGSSSPFYIENIFEELDVPGEWFLDSETNTLYYYPFEQMDINDVLIEAATVKDHINIISTSEDPVHHIEFHGFTFTQSNTTFMEKYEPLSRGDWAIHRGGAIFMEGTEDIIISDCNFEYTGGNGVFMSKYNRRNSVLNSRFYHTGESGVCFVGDPNAVRHYLTWDQSPEEWMAARENMDLEPGPKSDNYPAECVVDNCIMYEIGDYGKQTSGVIVSMSSKITVSHCDIYNIPRAGITVNDGTWGGHIIEFNDIWETVRESGEHGPFNSWGRERFWLSGKGEGEMIKEQVLLDAVDPVIIRNNRISNFRKSLSAGNWTIDLDDGSSNYQIYNNLSLGSTLKLRDGYYRKVWNNIHISAVPIGWHCWPAESEDEFYSNINVIAGEVEGSAEPTTIFIKPARLPNAKLGKNIDNNLYYNINKPSLDRISPEFTLRAWNKTGNDINSEFADPLFSDPAMGNYYVSENSPALGLGFENFDMENFGHRMTKIISFGTEFEDQIVVKIKADQRTGETRKSNIHYTVDGSIPTLKSPIYKDSLVLKTNTKLKAATINSSGTLIGFIAEKDFNKVEEVYIPSWYRTVIDGSYDGDVKDEKSAVVMIWNGAALVTIQDDPDLIDAAGGVDYGCFIKKIDDKEGAKLKAAGFKPYMTIRKVNGIVVYTLEDFQKVLRTERNKTLEFECISGYETLIFKLEK